MEIERRDVVQQSQLVEVAESGQRCNLLRAFDDCGTKPHRYCDRDIERLHQRAGVLAESLLARHELVAVMAVFHLPLLQVAREADIVMRGEQQAGAFAFEPLANGLDFLRCGFLFGKEVVQPEHQERVGVGQNPFVNRQLVAGLIDALEHSDRVAGGFAGDLLEVKRGPMEQLQRAGDALEEFICVPLRRLKVRPRTCGLRSSWRSDYPIRRGRGWSPTDSSTSSRCSRGVCPPCICGRCGFGCRCGPVLVCSWLFLISFVRSEVDARCSLPDVLANSLSG